MDRRELLTALRHDLEAGAPAPGEPATRFVPAGGPASLGAPRLADGDIAALGRAYRAGTVSPAATTAKALARARADRHRAFLLVLDETAAADAAAAAERIAAGQSRGPLDGVPVAVKDVIDIAGTATTGGSAILRDHRAEADAPCAKALKAAGAVIVGKTALHEWAYGVTSDNPHFGRVGNPAAPGRIPGGSSGGSAAVVAAGIVPAALGSDTGGSIRIPAACCGIVGFKPTYDLISREGGVAQAWSLDHIGPLARTVEDAWALAHAAAGGTGDAQGESAAASLAGRRLGVLSGWEDVASDAVGTRHAKRLERLRIAGADLVSFAYPQAAAARAAWLTIIIAESAAYHRRNMAARPGDISPDVRAFLEAGADVSARDYLLAQQVRRAWCAEVAQSMAGLDAVIAPTLPDVAPEFGRETLDLRCGAVPVRDALVHYQWPANLLGAPSISLPGNLPAGELPVGIMATGRPWADGALLALAAAIERELAGEAAE